MPSFIVNKDFTSFKKTPPKETSVFLMEEPCHPTCMDFSDILQ